jgi:hypothetical protein
MAGRRSSSNPARAPPDRHRRRHRLSAAHSFSRPRHLQPIGSPADQTRDSRIACAPTVAAVMAARPGMPSLLWRDGRVGGRRELERLGRLPARQAAEGREASVSVSLRPRLRSIGELAGLVGVRLRRAHLVPCWGLTSAGVSNFRMLVVCTPMAMHMRIGMGGEWFQQTGAGALLVFGMSSQS